MTRAISDRQAIKIDEETNWADGGGGSPQNIRYTSESLKQNTQTTQSAELRSDRQVADVIRTSLNAEGDINYELSASTFDLMIRAALLTTSSFAVATDAITNGTDLVSLAVTKMFKDNGQSAKYPGCVINEWTLEAATESVVTGSFSLLGEKEVSGTDNADGTAAPTGNVMNVIDHISAISRGGSAVDLTQFSLNLNNNFRQLPQLKNLGPIIVKPGKLSVTGTIRRYFEDASLIDEYLNFNDDSLEIKFRDDSSAGYDILIPKLKWTDGQRVAGGENEDVVADMSFTAYRDSTEDAMIKVTKQ